MSLPQSLLTMPNEVLNNIVQDFDYKEIFQLRQVCKRLKDYVAVAKPDLNIKYITIISITNGFSINFGTNIEDIKERIPKYMKSLIISHHEEDKWRLLKTLLDHQKSTLDRFSLFCRGKETLEGYTKSLDFLKYHLSDHDRKLNVFALYIDVLEQYDVMKILPNLHPKTFKEIHLRNATAEGFYSNSTRKVLQIDEIMELDQWKQAEKFNGEAFNFQENIDKFCHFKKVFVRFASFSMTEAVKLKEKLLHPPHDKLIDIMFDHFNQNLDPESLGNFVLDESFGTRRSYTIPIPNNENIFLYILITNDCIRFIHREKVQPKSRDIIVAPNWGVVNLNIDVVDIE